MIITNIVKAENKIVIELQIENEILTNVDFLNQGIELTRVDMSENTFKSGPPAPNTTLGWLNENVILTNLKWDFNYTFKIRTFNFNSFNIYSDWVELNVFEENLCMSLLI